MAWPKDCMLNELIERQVGRTPDAVAGVFEDRQLTYQQLNDRVDLLAHHLRNLGVGPNALVGICVERSLEMLVGLLGILKAGGAYVPLDAAYPSDRLAFMLQDSQPRVLLTQTSLQKRCPDPPGSDHLFGSCRNHSLTVAARPAVRAERFGLCSLHIRLNG